MESEISYKGLHGLSPYIGKIRPSLAKCLIQEHCPQNGVVFDPFCGSGTVPLEGWINGRRVIANDLNTYAVLITRGKLFPLPSEKVAQLRLQTYNKILQTRTGEKNTVPDWVKAFFHPKTLSEIICWVDVFKSKREFFLLSSLLGILHHQRPGFLSFPSSHGTPYLRKNKFPQSEYPEMYEYRNVFERLSSKVNRVFKNFPELDTRLSRTITNNCASQCKIKLNRVQMILTSPPYMKALTYARDNRLRLWFLGVEDHRNLEATISPSKSEFKLLMEKSFSHWKLFQKRNDKCVLVVGDMYFDKARRESLTEFIIETSEKAGYGLVSVLKDPIPLKKRFIKRASSIDAEHIITLKKKNN